MISLCSCVCCFFFLLLNVHAVLITPQLDAKSPNVLLLLPIPAFPLVLVFLAGHLISSECFIRFELNYQLKKKRILAFSEYFYNNF